MARESREQAERLFAVGRYAEADVLRWRVEEAQQQQLLVQHRPVKQVPAIAQPFAVVADDYNHRAAIEIVGGHPGVADGSRVRLRLSSMAGPIIRELKP